MTPDDITAAKAALVTAIKPIVDQYNLTLEYTATENTQPSISDTIVGTTVS